MKRFGAFGRVLEHFGEFWRVLESFRAFRRVLDLYAKKRWKKVHYLQFDVFHVLHVIQVQPGRFLAQNFSSFNSYSFTKLSFSFSSISFWGQGHVFGHFYLWPLSDTMYESGHSHNTMAVLVHDVMYENGHNYGLSRTRD